MNKSIPFWNFCTAMRTRRAERLTPLWLMTALLTGFFAVNANAVHLKGNIELDGNLVNDGAGVPGVDDWNDVFAGTDQSTRSTFVVDSAVLDSTTFSGSVKDIQSLGQWTCTKAKVQNKSNIMHAYAATYVDDGELLLYAGADREGELGDSNMGVWLFQQPVSCESTGRATPFTGTHIDGDLLVVSEFDNGGRVESLKVYRWTDPDGIPQSGDECLGGGAGNCSDAGKPFFSGLNCSDSNPNDATCGRTNPLVPVNAAWRNGIPKQGLFEMGINISSLIGNTGCFANALIETRSSTSLTATLKDFVSLGISTCSSVTVNKSTQGGDGLFDFTIDPDVGGADAFQLSDGGNETFPNVENGTYVIAETSVPDGPAAPFGWHLADASCTGTTSGLPQFIDSGFGGGSITVDIGNSEDVSCLFENEFNPPPGSITIQKICDSVDPGAQTFDFTLGAFGGSSNAACADGTETLACGESVTCTGLAAGKYTVVESAVPGWEISAVDCLGNATCGEALSPHADIDLGSADDAVITFTNDELATIEICKTTLPAATGGDFAFEGDLGMFTLADAACSKFELLLSGQVYEISESLHAGFVLDNINCSGTNWSADSVGTRSVTVIPEAGEEISCEFSNLQNPGFIQVCKQTVTTGVGDSTFEIILDGPFPGLPVSTSLANGECDMGPADPGALALPVGGGYAVMETALSGWDTSVSCTGSGGAEDPANINLAADELVTCTFINSERGRIIVSKATLPVASPQSFFFSGDLEGSLIDGQSLELSVAAGTYTVSENATPGWDLNNISCDDADSAAAGSTATFNVDAGEVVNCLFTNVQRGSIIAAKRTLPSGAPDSFNFSGDLSGNLQDGDTINMDVAPGNYSVTETTKVDWTLQRIDCDDDDSIGTGSTADYIVAPGEVVTCTFSNAQAGRIAVFKQTLPSGSPQTFDFGGDLAGSIADGGIIELAVVAGTYTTTEAALSGWDLSGIVCDDADSFGSGQTATFNVSDGEIVTCTFTNVQRGRIVAGKRTIPAAASEAFVFSGDLTGELQDGQALSMEVAPGNYAVTESPLPDWSLQSISCDDNDSVGSGTAATYSVAPGEVVNCLFTNVQAGRIVVLKQTFPQGSPQSFSFSGDLAGDVADGGFIDLAVGAGTYTATESPLPGWDLDDISCDDNDSYQSGQSAVFNVSDGEVVTCTFTNVQRGRIVAGKRTLPAGAPDSFGFSGDLVGNLQDGGFLTLEVAPGNYSVSEAPVTGWTLQRIDCDDDDSIGTGSTAGYIVAPGEVVTCTFNNAQPGRIAVFKQTLPAGSPQSFAFSGDLAGSIADGGVIELAVGAGTYTTTEATVPGWDLDSIVCDDDDSSGSGQTATFNVSDGEIVTCTFLNIDHARITVVKSAVGPDASFCFEAIGPGLNSPFCIDTINDSGQYVLDNLAAGNYQVLELGTVGWIPVGASCNNGDQPSLVNVTAGADIICQFDNLPEDIPPPPPPPPPPAVPPVAVPVGGFWWFALLMFSLIAFGMAAVTQRNRLA